VPDLVICNCYDAGALDSWALTHFDLDLSPLRAVDGSIFVRGIVFCPESEYSWLRSRCPAHFRLAPMTDGSGELAYCAEEDLAGLLDRVAEMTAITPINALEIPEAMVLPAVGDMVLIVMPPLINEKYAEVTRVSPETGNVRVVIEGKFWSISWKFIEPLKETAPCS